MMKKSKLINSGKLFGRVWLDYVKFKQKFLIRLSKETPEDFPPILCLL